MSRMRCLLDPGIVRQTHLNPALVPEQKPKDLFSFNALLVVFY